MRIVAIPYADPTDGFWYGRVVPVNGLMVQPSKECGKLLYAVRVLQLIGHLGSRLILTDDESDTAVYTGIGVQQCIQLKAEETKSGWIVNPPNPKGNQAGYASRTRMFDPDKLGIHRRMCEYATRVTHALVLDCETFNSTDYIQRHFPNLRYGGIDVVNKHARATWRKRGVRVICAELNDYLLTCAMKYDLMFLDHCGAFKTEKTALETAIQRDLVDGLLVATYSVRGNGKGCTLATLRQQIRMFMSDACSCYQRQYTELDCFTYNRMLVFFWKIG